VSYNCRPFLPRSAAANIAAVRDAFDRAAHRLSNRRRRRDMTLASLAAQMSGLLDAIRILLVRGREPPAFGLCRIAFEASLWIAYICARSESADDRSRDYRASAARESARYLRTVENAVTILSTEERERLRALSLDPRVRRYMAYRRKGKGKDWPNISDRISGLENPDKQHAFAVFRFYLWSPGSQYLHAGAPGASAYLGPRGIVSTRPSRHMTFECYIAAATVAHEALESLSAHRKCGDLAGSVRKPIQLRRRRATMPLW
jgi:hypothetical protein